MPDALLDPVVLRRLLGTLLVVVAAFTLARLGRQLAFHTFDEQERQYRAAKWISRALWIGAVVAIVALWSPSASNLITVLTIIGAGLAVALRDVLLSVVGWLRLSLYPPYRPGDRIEINGIRGDVADIGVLQTVVVEIGEWVQANQSTGRIVHIPNGWIYQHGVKNYTEGFESIWMEESVTVTFASDWRAAKQIMLDAVAEEGPDVEAAVRQQIKQTAREYLVHFNVLTPYVYTNLAPNGITLTLRVMAPVRGQRNLRSTVVEDVLDRFHAHDQIEIAYPTLRVAPDSRRPPGLPPAAP
jgi:small-conductance mechanosensitive channel